MNVLRGFSSRVRTLKYYDTVEVYSHFNHFAFSQSQCMGMTLNQLCTQPSASCRYVFYMYVFILQPKMQYVK